LSEKFFIKKAMQSDSYNWDIFDKFSVINYIRKYKLYGLEGDDCALKFSRETSLLTSDPFIDIRKIKFLIPDVIVWSHEKSPIIFEIDGDSHKDGTTEQTKLRNMLYTKNRLNFIVIDKAKLKAENTNWKDYIDKELSKLGII